MGTAETLFRRGSSGLQIAALIENEAAARAACAPPSITELNANREKLNRLSFDLAATNRQQMQNLKNSFVILGIAAVLTISVIIVRQEAQAQATNPQPKSKMDGMMGDTTRAKTNNHKASPIFVTEIPPGYRDWKLISVAHEEGHLTDIRAILGNDIAIKAYREGTLPLPEGSIIARIAWSYDSSEENNKSFVPFLKPGGVQHSFVAGSPTNGVQFMIKDSVKYAATGGWGYGHFNDSKPAAPAFMQSCYACHKAVESRDYVFARYAP
jgi:hypothetical protein